MLHKDPDKRMGRNGINEIKAHPWFEEIDFGMVEAKYLDPPFVPNVTHRIFYVSYFDKGSSPRTNHFSLSLMK